MKKTIVLFCAFAVIVSSAIYASEQDANAKSKISQKQTQELYKKTKLLSALSMAFLLGLFYDDNIVTKSGWIGTSFLSFLAHSVLIRRAKQCHNFNIISVGVGLVVNPVIASLAFAYKNDAISYDMAFHAGRFSAVVGVLKVMYDGYDYFTNQSEDESDDAVAI